jgi:hypothetical protein
LAALLLRAVAFFAAGFLRAVVFLRVARLAVDFLAADFLRAAGLRAVLFLRVARFAVDFLAPVRLRVAAAFFPAAERLAEVRFLAVLFFAIAMLCLPSI